MTAPDQTDRDASQWLPSESTLRRRVVLVLGIAGIVVFGVGGWLVLTRMTDVLRDAANSRLVEDARRGVLVVQQQMNERARQVELIGSTPTVVDAALEGGQRARALGLVGQPIAALEQRFTVERTMGVAPRAHAFLVSEIRPLDIAEVLVTDVNGFNAVTTEKTSDFVQSDEGWWTEAVARGLTSATAVYDESAAQVVVSLAGAVRERDRDKAIGAIKIQFGLRTLEKSLAGAASSRTTVYDVIDSSGRVVATTSGQVRFRVLPGAGAVLAAPTGVVTEYETEDGHVRAAVTSLNGELWRLVAHEDADILGAVIAARQRLVLGGAAGVFLVMLVMLWFVSRFIERRITTPVAALARVSEAVAAGDLSQRFAPSASDDEIGRLGRAIASMVGELSRLATEMRSAGASTASFAKSITMGAEGLSASAQEIAGTSNDLSRRTVDMADTIQKMSSDASRLREIASQMSTGARTGVERNTALRTLAQENRARFDDSATTLERLHAEVTENAQAVEALALASAEIRAFVTLVQKMSRQSKLLALNAAMEAARAGEHGQGFAVVASEVRRLAAGASESAERTEALVRQVLERIEHSRESSARSVATLDHVRAATRHGLESFGLVEQAVAESESWTNALAELAGTSQQLTDDVTERLRRVAEGAESFASAMQQVAATTEEQSASTQEIAAAATSLAEAAARLQHLVTAFRLGGDRPGAPRARPESQAEAGEPRPSASIVMPALPPLATA